MKLNRDYIEKLAALFEMLVDIEKDTKQDV